jgi:signal transduction histidine kinase
MSAPCIILLIAESTDDQVVYRRFLQCSARYDYRLVICGTMPAAFTQVQSKLPDVILLDLESVDRAGMEYVRQFKQHLDGQGVPMVLLGTGNAAIRAQAANLAACEYLIKPTLTAELLCRTVQCVVYEHHCARQLQQIREQAQQELARRLQAETRLQQLEQELELRVWQRTQELERSQALLSQREQSTLEALEKERELNELKSRFVSMISHEFRTPLTTIQSATELLDYYEWTDDERQERFQQIYHSVQHMTQLLDDVLLIGKVEAGKLSLQAELIQLSELCQAIIGEFRSAVGRNHLLTLTIVGQAQLVWLDPKLLRQILSNLLSNAIKYTPSQQSIHLQVEYLQEHIRLWVQDTGIGIPESDQPWIFEAFFRATNVETIQGTGLGLAIVKRCVELQGGKIAVKSQVGVGTTFLITLPLRLTEEAAIVH